MGKLMRRASNLITSAQLPQKTDNKNIKDDAMSFRSKTMTLKMLIKNKESRKVFFSFLEKTRSGKEEILDYYLFIETIKKQKDSVLFSETTRKAFIDIVAQYEKKAEG